MLWKYCYYTMLLIAKSIISCFYRCIVSTRIEWIISRLRIDRYCHAINNIER